MKKNITEKLTITTFIVCILYISIFFFSRIDLIQKQNGGDISEKARAAFTCPSGYIEIADFCIQSALSSDESWVDASEACSQNGKARLCKTQELMAACQAEKNDGVFFDDDIDGPDWEWVDDFANSGQAVVAFGNSNGCKDIGKDNIITDLNKFRCCMNRY